MTAVDTDTVVDVDVDDVVNLYMMVHDYCDCVPVDYDGCYD